MHIARQNIYAFGIYYVGVITNTYDPENVNAVPLKRRETI